MVNASNTRAREMQEQLARVERLFPELSRPGGRRRGEVILSQDEAWQLMSRTGDVLAAAGFDVRVPALSRRKPTPGLRLTADEAQESVVGAQQLANVRWSVVFGDVELTAGRRPATGRPGPAAGPHRATSGSSSTRPICARPRPRWPSGPTRPS